jgi:hypothetical protein
MESSRITAVGACMAFTAWPAALDQFDINVHMEDLSRLQIKIPNLYVARKEMGGPALPNLWIVCCVCSLVHSRS